MLILRGIRGTFGGVKYDGKEGRQDGALDEPSALAYAKARGFEGRVLNVHGQPFDGSLQMQKTLEVYRCFEDVTALYGFSGGGYNLRHIIGHMNATELERLKLVVALGAPPPKSIGHDAWVKSFSGPWELVYREDPPQGHMAGPAVLLKELDRV